MHLKKTVTKSAVERNKINEREVVVPNVVGEGIIEAVARKRSISEPMMTR